MSEKWRQLFAFGTACFLVMWSLTLLGFWARPLVDKHAFSFSTDSGTSVSDFVEFYQCGAMTLSPEHLHVYDADVQKRFTNDLISPDKIEHVFNIQYVPFMFPLMAPWAVLSIQQAYTLWYSLSLLAGAAAVWLLSKDTKRFSKVDLVILFSGLVSTVSAIIALKIGQSSWFLLLFLSMVYHAVKYQKNILGGLSMAMLSIKPQYIPLLLAAFSGARRWQLIFFSAVFEALLFVLAGLSIGWSNVFNYPSILSHAESYVQNSGVNPAGMISIRGLLSQFLPQKTVLLSGSLLLATAAILIFILWRSAKGKEISLEWKLSLTVVSCLVFSPHSHVYDLLLLAVPAILTLPSLSLVKIVASRDLALIIWSLILLSFPLTGWLAYCSGYPSLILLLNLLLLGSGCFFVYKTKSGTINDLPTSP